jgi:hypothetical protein
MPRILTTEELRELRAMMATGSLEAGHARALMRRARAGGITAVRHPLGFVCVPLFRSTGAGLCMHVWADGIPALPLTTSPMHAHTWDLTSHVLSGQVSNELVRVDPDARRPTHRILAVYSRGHTDEIRRTGRVAACRVTGTQVVTAGQTYTLKAGCFHATRVSTPVVTLVVADTRRPPPELVLGAITTRTHRVLRKVCGAEDLRIIAEVLGGDPRR